MKADINFEIYQVLHEVSRNMHHLAHEIGDEQGIKQEIGRSLNFIADTQNATAKAFSEYYHIKPSSATVKINKLVEDGFVIKEKDPNDLRSVILLLSDKGEQQRQLINQHTSQLIHGIFDDLSPNQKSVFLDELKLINHQLLSRNVNN